ncbi:CDP-alcohol phosphatidyltransferase [Trinorchestia longiramus]|nr:CDP-alcohol phosphatidyltransferase [Trinorchestia longiramus]
MLSPPAAFPLFLGSQFNGACATHASLPHSSEWKLLCRHFGRARQDSETAIDWNLAPNKKLLETRTKLEKAKHKLEGAKQNIMEDIQDTKALVREKMDAIIEKENIMTVPNLLCISRIVAAPFLCHLVVSGAYDLALGLFVLAGITDLADGWIARVFPSQASKLGSFLDPLADKVLVAVLFLSLTYNGLIPIPLTGIIIYRDVAIIAAASYVRYKSLPSPRTVMRYFDATHATVQLSPTTVSKVNTAVQLGLITATLAQPVFALPSPAVMTGLWVLTIGTTVASGASYIFSRNTYTFISKLDRQPQDSHVTEPSAKDDSQIRQKPKDI